jgi:isocitrate lyase
MQEESVPASRIDQYLSAVASGPALSLAARRKVAAQVTKAPVFFSWDIPRTREGFYHYKAGLGAAVKRAIAFAPYADLLWLETATPSVATAAGFAHAIRTQHPGKQLVYNLSPSFNWMAHGFTEASLKSFVWDLAKHG